jgi:hypothetical protein
MTVVKVWYTFEVETEGLPRSSWNPPPRDIDVTYRNLRAGRLVTREGVGSEWAMGFWRPRFGRGRLEATAHGGGNMWCVVEVNRRDGSGVTISDRGRHSCRIKRNFGMPYPWEPAHGALQ